MTEKETLLKLAIEKIKATRKTTTEQYISAVKRNDERTFKSLRFAKDTLAEVETSLESLASSAPQNSQKKDELKELRAMLQERRKRQSLISILWLIHRIDALIEKRETRA